MSQSAHPPLAWNSRQTNIVPTTGALILHLSGIRTVPIPSTHGYADKQELEESIIRRHYGTVAEEEPPQDVPAAVGGMNHGMQAEKNSRKTILRP